MYVSMILAIADTTKFILGAFYELYLMFDVYCCFLCIVLGVISICLFPLWPFEGSAGIISRLSWIAISLLRIILALYIGS